MTDERKDQTLEKCGCPKEKPTSIDILSYSTSIDAYCENKLTPRKSVDSAVSSNFPTKSYHRAKYRFMRSIANIKNVYHNVVKADFKEMFNTEFGLPEEDSSDKIPAASSGKSALSGSSEQLLSYVKTPFRLEGFMLLGLTYSLIVLLKWFAVVPSRFLTYSICALRSVVKDKNVRTSLLTSNHWSSINKYKNDAIFVLLTIFSLLMLTGLDESKIYHKVKSGTSMKLYFMVGLLEIANKLLSAVGQDIIELLFRISILKLTKDKRIRFVHHALLKFVLVALLSILYLTFHSIIMVYQVMALNVAVNSYSNALLTLILSSQFSELKGSVFKRIEREGLFQLVCADLNERFMLFTMLLVISSRNMLQLVSNGASLSSLFDNLKPNSWYSDLTFSKSLNDWIGFLVGPSFVVIGSEILVDWLKHTYIIKFNKIRPRVYRKYASVLAKDYLADFEFSHSDEQDNHPITKDIPEILIKRTGLPVFTLCVVLFKMTIFPWMGFVVDSENIFLSVLLVIMILILCSFLTICFKMVLSLILAEFCKTFVSLKTSGHIKEDYFPGNPNVHLSDASDVRNEFYEAGETIPLSLEDKRKERIKKDDDDKLDSVTRFEMVGKRIW